MFRVFSKNDKYTKESRFLSLRNNGYCLVNALSKRFDTLYIKIYIMPIAKRFYKKYKFLFN